MTVRRLIIAVGAVLLVAGVIGLLVPVQVSNSNGGTVSCGNGLATDLSGARAANDRNGANIPILNEIIPHTDFVAQCESAVSSRRMWTIPLTVIGIVGVAGALLVRRTRGAPVDV
ncbi:MAG: aminopeptidase [Mycobacterium sp.]|uniref:Aminopeptidase n=2 Tax=Mycobacterium gordonae TaxID=1778 RepID=A0A1A6B9R3_MYCGO|nr:MULTISPECIES: aminopeptidase [Mycobacterium]MBI2701885.1 aminopeptidase [Mycobacterium sp.]MBX9983475.1 aminopeptidase [Mycobacterium gordonae]MCQ4363712.1 aminopeptidase [Mycobacterium gordonae]MCV7005927.1 aminopeptidase [Mycobacterium gordonae]OBR99064.1 aminopeptidase [Mycobacterium gordonae]